ncbi:hypothetical protein AB3S75_026602 [Citrus x aurantiifolia]
MGVAAVGIGVVVGVGIVIGGPGDIVGVAEEGPKREGEAAQMAEREATEEVQDLVSRQPLGITRYVLAHVC